MERTGDPNQPVTRGKMTAWIPMRGLSVATDTPWAWSITCAWCGRVDTLGKSDHAVKDTAQHISTVNGWEIGYGTVTCPDCVETDEWLQLGQEWLEKWPEHLWQYNVPLVNRMDWHPPLVVSPLSRYSRWTVMARSYRDACRQIQERLDRECGHATYTVVYGIGEPEGYDTQIAVFFTEELM